MGTQRRRYLGWGTIPALSHMTKFDFAVSDSERVAANALVSQFLEENPNACQSEQINFMRVLILTMQLRAASNRHMTMSGVHVKDDTLTPEEFQQIKMKERQLIPQLDKQLSDALAKTGNTGQQKRVSDDVKTSAEAASLVYAQAMRREQDAEQSY